MTFHSILVLPDLSMWWRYRVWLGVGAEAGAQGRVRLEGKAPAREALASRLPKPYNAATYRQSVPKPVPLTLSSYLNKEKHTGPWLKTRAPNPESWKELSDQVIWKNRPLSWASSVQLHNLIRIITWQPKLSRGIMSHKFRSHVNPFAQLKLSNF